MHHPTTSPLALLVFLGMLLSVLQSASQEIGFVERFALADDREAALKELVPGTEDYYYYHALHFQHTEERADLDKILGLWSKRTKNSALRKKIIDRQAFLDYEADPKASLEHIRRQLNLQFNHHRENKNAVPKLPTTLDPASLSRSAFLTDARRNTDSLNNVTSSGLDHLLGNPKLLATLDTAELRDLLSRTTRPDHAHLVEQIARELKTDSNQGFGHFKIHWNLTAAQLDALGKELPELKGQVNFVDAKLRRLLPDADKNMERQPEVEGTYLAAAYAYLKDLAPAFNSHKAHFLHRLLVHHRDDKNAFPKELFLDYLKLPRNVGLVEPDYLKSDPDLSRWTANLDQNFPRACDHPPVSSSADAALVRSYLTDYFISEATWEPYAKYLRDDYLKPLFAEAKILHGVGNAEDWASLISPTQYQALKDRVEIEFAPTNPVHHKTSDEVAIEVDLKNVSKLIVKVFEINTLGYYLAHPRELNTDLDLDGLVPSTEKTFEYKTDPAVRGRERFVFPEIGERRGVWIVEFIGNSKSSRALVRKGDLTPIVQPAASGQRITVLAENRAVVKDAEVWFAGRKFVADDEGQLLIPHSADQGHLPMVLADGATEGAFGSLAHLPRAGENYSLQARFHIDRESLLRRGVATLLVRPTVLLNGLPSNLELLEDSVLSITATDLDGTSTTQRVPDFELYLDRESTYEIAVPERLSSLDFSLSGKVKSIAGTTQELAFNNLLRPMINQIDASTQVADIHLSRDADGFVLDLLGRNGEPLPERTLVGHYRHRDFTTERHISLKTDGAGRTRLGALEDISFLRVSSAGLQEKHFPLPTNHNTYPSSAHAVLGEEVQIPFHGDDTEQNPDRSQLSLLERRGGHFHTDHFDKLSLADGLITVKDLPAGDFSLQLKGATPRQVLIRVTAPLASVQGRAFGETRTLELRERRPLQIAELTADNTNLTIRLANSTGLSRIHVVANHFVPRFPIAEHLKGLPGIEPMIGIPSNRSSLYFSGRIIGDEYRYIIDRKYAEKFPGVMAPRPGLLLNPWALRDTGTETDSAESGTAFGASAAQAASESERAMGEVYGDKTAPADFANLDFLASGGIVLANIKVGKDGIASIPLVDLGDRHLVTVLAADHNSLAARHLTLPEPDSIPLRDLRLRNGLDPKVDFTQQQKITLLAKGNKLAIDDIVNSRFEAYDSLSSVFKLFRSINADPHLNEFSFVLDWPSFDAEKKRSLYSKYACHELSFFLSQRDPAFFNEVITPYLANKKDKTFIDHYLLDADLSAYLQPYQYGRLNIFERALLARSGGADGKGGARHLDDLFQNLPPNLAHRAKLFEIAVNASSLSRGDRFGFDDAKRSQSLMSVDAAFEEMAPGESGGTDPYAAPPAPASATPSRSSGLVKKQVIQATPKSKAAKTELGPRYAVEAMDESQSMLTENIDDLLIETETMDSRLLELVDGEREEIRQFWRKLGATKEWAENNYYKLPIKSQTASLIEINGFWRDFAAWDGNGVFLTEYLTDATGSFSEMMVALSVIGLPFDSVEHQTETAEGGTFTLTSGGPVIVFHEEIRPAEKAEGEQTLLVGQHFFREGDRHRDVDGQPVEKYVTEEFLVGAVYGCQLVVTNPTGTTRQLDVLSQIPHGAIEVNHSRATQTKTVDVGPYATVAQEFYFYFPQPGSFAHFPVHVADAEKVAAAAAPFVFNAVEKLSIIDKASWDYISQWGTDDEVMAFLEESNIERYDLARVAWRCRESADFFKEMTRLLDSRHKYHSTIYSYGIHHNHPAAATAFLLHRNDLADRVGPYLSSALLTIDPVERHRYQHLEYSPLVNARAHALGGVRKILNPDLHLQHHAFMDILAHKDSLDDTDELAVAYLLLLQDRFEEGLAWFGRADRAKVTTGLQYDYMAAIASMLQGDLPAARGIADQYAEHPVDKWAAKFAEVRSHLDEAAGREAGGVNNDPDAGDGADREGKQDALADTEPSSGLEVVDGVAKITYRNLPSVTLNLYEMDLEFLFSSNPFVSSGGGNRFSIVRPNQTLEVELDPAKSLHEFSLPAEYQKANVLVELVAAGMRRTQASYANQLNVDLIENYGRLQVTHAETNTPLAKTYIKVYADTPRGPVFYKDGYTDLRGKFDYASLNTGNIDNATRFSILVMSEDHGALVLEAGLPEG